MEQRSEGLLTASESNIGKNVGNYSIFLYQNSNGNKTLQIFKPKFKNHRNIPKPPLRDVSISNSIFESFVCTFIHSSFNKHFLNTTMGQALCKLFQ